MDQLKFKELQKKWYKKLKDKGFVDAENTENGLLKSFHSYSSGQHSENPIVNQAKASYYRMAEHLLNDHTFKSPVHRFIWKNHSEGTAQRDIIKLVAKKYGIKVGRWTVNHIINGLAEVMKAKYRNQEDEQE